MALPHRPDHRRLRAV